MQEEQFQATRTEIEEIIKNAEKFGNDIKQEIPAYNWSQDFCEQLAEIHKKWKNQSFLMAVMALVNAGKSTLINAWLGDEYLPSGTLPETMRMVRIRHSVESPEGILTDGEQTISEGMLNIRNYLRQLNEEARNTISVATESELILKAPLIALSNKSLGEQGFDIIDAPGSNEFGIDALGAKIERLLRDVDVIVYLLDYTKLNTEDENKMLANLSQLRSDLVRDLSKRMFFVVNKIDITNRHDYEKRLGKEEVAAYVVKILREQVNGLQITTDQVLLTSADKAVLSRLIINDRASTQQLEDFKKYAFGESGSEDTTEEECKEAAPRILKKSGIEQLENKILSFIYENRSQILLTSVVDALHRLLTQTYNNLEVARGAVLTDIKIIKQLKNDIKDIRKELNEISLQTQIFKKSINDSTTEKFQDFQKSIFKQIKLIFEKSDDLIITKGILPREITDFLGTTNFKIESNNKDEVMKQVQILNKSIFSFVEIRFNLFWNNFIEDFHIYYKNFSDQLQQDIQPLVIRIENKLEESLNISLIPSVLTLNTPKLDDFSKNIHQGINNFIKEEEQFNPRFGITTFNFPGLEIFGISIIDPLDIPILIVKITETKYSTSSNEYRQYIADRIAPILENARKVTSSVIEKNFENVLTQAKNVLEDYSEQYIKIIETEVKQIHKESDITKRSIKIKKDIKSVKELLEMLNRCRDICKE